MKQKTAIEQIYEDLNKIRKGLKISGQWSKQDDGVFMNILTMKEQFIKIEREQIEEAYNQDLYGGLSGHQKFNDGADYYQQKYGDEKTTL